MTTQQNCKPVIVLDAGRVLVDINPDIVLEELSKTYRKEMAAPLPFDLEELFYPAYVGTRSMRDIFQYINKSLGLSLGQSEWQELWCSVLIGEVPGMRETLAELKGRFRLVALSNTEEMHWLFALKRFPVFRLLDGWVVSYAEGVAKPDPAIYHAVVDRYCCGGLPFFFTDDIPHNVEAAQRLGWDAEVFRGAEHFMGAVTKRVV